jgi:hypothetical protein
MSVNSGGPAFPVHEYSFGRELTGMTLRDYFAAAALCGLVADGAVSTFDLAATESYNFADAMLKAREVER